MSPESRLIALADYQPHPRNYNRHPATQIERIATSLRKFGQVRSVVVWRNYFLAGHGVREAALSLGWESLRADVLPDEYPEALALAYVAADNELGRLSDPDQEQLAAILSEAKAFDAELLQAIGYDDQEFDKLLAEVGGVGGGAGGDAEPQVDRAEELRQQWGVALGQLWRLPSRDGKGEHRLICGDCTDAATVARVMGGEKAVLMVTDPPYGVEYDPAWRNEAAEKGLISYAARSVGTVANDDRVDWSDAYKLVAAQVAYVWHADRHASDVQTSIEAAGYQIVCQIIWAKPVFAISRGDYHWQHEPCWYAVKKGKTHNWQGSRSESTLWSIGRGIPEKSGHGTEKPIERMAKPIENNTATGDIVCDPFVGSGTTLIACENLSRYCRAVELSPGYVAVTLQRYADAFGIQPELLTDG